MAATAVPLPPGACQFIDEDGAPYANGYVYTYVPGTATAKTTWQDPAQAIPNTNPILLDGAGRAVIWGSGIYRQQLWDQYGNLIWDAETEAADPNYIIGLLPNFTGDMGSGGAAGLVPAPAAGSTAAGQYLSANGSFTGLNVVVPTSPTATQAGKLFVPTRTIATTTGSLVLTDAAGSIQYSNASPGTLTISNDATANWLTTVVTQIMLNNLVGSGVWTLAPGSGVTLVAPGLTATSGNRLVAANGQVLLSRLTSNYWTVIGGGLS